VCCVCVSMYVCIATRSVPCLLFVLIITVTVTHRILAIPPSHCASTYNTTSDFDSPTLIHIQPNNLVIATCYLLLSTPACKLYPQRLPNKQTPLNPPGINQ
jgi:hypothetical protein